MKKFIAKKLNNPGTYEVRVALISTIRSSKCEESRHDDLMRIVGFVDETPVELPLVSVRNEQACSFTLDPIMAQLELFGEITAKTENEMFTKQLAAIRKEISDQQHVLRVTIKETQWTELGFDEEGKVVESIRTGTNVSFF